MKYYTGIGSRETPEDIQSWMKAFAIRMQKHGYTLRSGGAGGADSAFEHGCGIFSVVDQVYTERIWFVREWISKMEFFTCSTNIDVMTLCAEIDHYCSSNTHSTK